MTPCVETDWNRNRSNNGYGYRNIGGRRWSAHRWAWTQTRGQIPAGMQVLHRCDNPPCIRVSPIREDGTPNPDDHLFLGTHADNMRDKADKGRNPTSKLTPLDVVEIRRRLGDGEMAVTIAHEYKVDPSTISNIKHRVTWKNPNTEAHS